MTHEATSKPRRARWVAGPVALLFLGLVSTFGATGGCTARNALVGGECRAGLRACGQVCVDPQTDPNNCGECGRGCPNGVPCINGVCGGTTDASLDGASSDGSLGDGSSDATVPDGAPTDGGNPDVQCVPPFNRPDQCGDCNTRCRADQDCLQVDGGGFACGPKCTPPLSACDGVCVDLQNDPNNCGVCGRFCVSFLCSMGECQGQNPGDIVVIGHDFVTANAATSQARVLANAAYIARSNPLRILSYERDANPNAIINVKAILANYAFGRTVQYTVSRNPAEIAAGNLLPRFDVVLIFDQQGRDAASLAADGATWAAPLQAFASRGGVVIALDGATGMGGMPSLLTSAGLLNLPGHTPLPQFRAVNVTAPIDIMAKNVVSPYAAFSNSASLQTTEPAGPNVIYVVRDSVAPNDPVVIHKIAQ